LAALLTENSPEVRAAPASAINAERVSELGIWLSGIESFLAVGHLSFGDTSETGGQPDPSREFRIVQSVLRRCSLANGWLITEPADSLPSGIKRRDLIELHSGLRDAVLLSETLARSVPLEINDWKAWSHLIIHRFHRIPAFRGIIRFAEREGERHLPQIFRDLGAIPQDLSNETVELAMVLPRFGKILKWLEVVGRMLEADEPLKPSLLLFARVNQQIFELTTYINGRLERFPDDEVELFASLDAASYTASIELKKVYSQELAGLARLRPPPSIYSRIQTAHALLSEGFQQILVGFARLIDPAASIFDLFPAFRLKRDASIVLRAELQELTRILQAAEISPDEKTIAELREHLERFMKEPVRALYYKDTETVERFIEEILVTEDNKDLVPILHRFGAYLETLF
jgi:hypothetical protein